MWVLFPFICAEFARWLSKPGIMTSRGAPGPTSGAVVQKRREDVNDGVEKRVNPDAAGLLGSLELGDDRELVDLSVLVGLQESLVVLERHAAVRIAIGAEHERVRQQSRPPVDSSLPDRIEAQRLHAVEGAFP